MKNQIRVYRAKKQMTQEDLAREMGVTRQTIISIEKSRYDPSLALAFHMAHFFGVKIEDIFTPDLKQKLKYGPSIVLGPKER